MPSRISLTAPQNSLPALPHKLPGSMSNPRSGDGAEGLCTIMDNNNNKNNKLKKKKRGQNRALGRIIFGSILQQLLWRKERIYTYIQARQRG